MAAPMRHFVFPWNKTANTYRLCSLYIVRRQKHKKPATLHCTLRRDIDVDADVAVDLTEHRVNHKSHAGITQLKAIRIPERLAHAVEAVTEKHRTSVITQEAVKLKEQMYRRQIPIESNVATNYLAELQEKYRQQDPDAKEERIRKLAMSEYKRHVHNWKPFSYQGYSGVVYIAARLAENYSIFLQILSEIHKRDQMFVPRNVYNFGSGSGSAIWAVDQIWKKDVFGYYCVDQSSDMNQLARLLLQDGSPQKNMSISGVTFHRFEPSDKNKFELVVNSHTLLEMPSKRDRLQMVESLWNKTENYMVLVEQGSIAGYNLVLEARDHILKPRKHKKTQIKMEEGHVFMPCTHDKTCPKLQFERFPCTFRVAYKPLGINKNNKPTEKQYEYYTYLVMKKGPRQEVSEEKSWPRIVQEVQCKPRHVHCHMCCPDGTYRHFILTKGKHSKNMYRCARVSDWGDLLPSSFLQYPPETWAEKRVTKKSMGRNRHAPELDTVTDTEEEFPEMDSQEVEDEESFSDRDSRDEDMVSDSYGINDEIDFKPQDVNMSSSVGKLDGSNGNKFSDSSDSESDSDWSSDENNEDREDLGSYSDEDSVSNEDLSITEDTSSKQGSSSEESKNNKDVKED